VPAGTEQDAELQLAIRKIMWEKVGVVRDEKGLTPALDELEVMAESHPRIAGEARNLLSVGRLVTAAALARRESRGGHYRSDFPAPDPEWQRRIHVTVAADGSAVLDAPGASESLMATVAAR